ncbi:hypothetical protein CERZMDRAFT_96392 [Cercospora zeae-maydis SCOH1-5]|uniref:Uncharacterized protein n=1 Tax=Cercospora zeae-maydis SCOH1-5 TaxID=717836 RepID=A0A6A6FJJ0_9PEZI|nr:hypothetical protein CERZMDRAFT_96392 [Cercospora zeae-maydis SCOH1-5]
MVASPRQPLSFTLHTQSEDHDGAENDVQRNLEGTTATADEYDRSKTEGSEKGNLRVSLPSRPSTTGSAPPKVCIRIPTRDHGDIAEYIRATRGSCNLMSDVEKMRLVTGWVAICTGASVVAAQDLAFTEPTKLDPSQHALNSKINAAWTTPFQYTNLELWQGPRADGSFAVISLLKNAPQNTTTYTWKAAPLDDMDFAPPFHFRLQKSDGDNLCDGCVVGSVTFSVANVGVNDNSILSSEDPNSGNGGLSSQSKLMIGLSIGIAATVVSAFVTLVCCTQRGKSPRSGPRNKAKKRTRTPISMMFRGYIDERWPSKASASERVRQVV